MGLAAPRHSSPRFFLGVLIGTYSSIYISVPTLVWLGVKPDSFLKADEKEEAEPETA